MKLLLRNAICCWCYLIEHWIYAHFMRAQETGQGLVLTINNHITGIRVCYVICICYDMSIFNATAQLHLHLVLIIYSCSNYFIVVFCYQYAPICVVCCCRYIRRCWSYCYHRRNRFGFALLFVNNENKPMVAQTQRKLDLFNMFQ